MSAVRLKALKVSDLRLALVNGLLARCAWALGGDTKGTRDAGRDLASGLNTCLFAQSDAQLLERLDDLLRLHCPNEPVFTEVLTTQNRSYAQAYNTVVRGARHELRVLRQLVLAKA